MKTIILIILAITFTGCMQFQRKACTEQVKDDYEWDSLSTEERLLVAAAHGSVFILGTGHLNISADGSIEADTTAKFETIANAADTVMKRVSDGAGKAAGMF